MTNGIPFLILMVEDDEDDRIIMDDAFVEIGFAADIKKFVNGEKLFHSLEAVHSPLYPSLIVLDNTLPKMSAAEILYQLKNDERYKHIPVIIYTSTASPNKKEELLELGAYKVVEKVSSVEELKKMAQEFKNLAEESKEHITDNAKHQ